MKVLCYWDLTALVAAFFLASASHALTISTVPIGNPGNPADTRYDPNGVGSVPYAFRMGVTEVTIAQYTEFLNSVAASDPHFLYPELYFPLQGIDRSGTPGSYTYSIRPNWVGTGPGGTDYTYANKPIVGISWYKAARFVNWLHNGQPNGPQAANTTEDGAYTLVGKTSTELEALTRNPGARWWLPNENEWYKAAYYDPDAGIYYDYPTGTNSEPNNNLPSLDKGNSENFNKNGYTTGRSDFPLTDAGAYTHSGSPYGTFDQGGSADEWNEDIVTTGDGGITHKQAVVRGGLWFWNVARLSAANRGLDFRFRDIPPIGFRVATLVPEPSSLLLGSLCSVPYLLRRRRSLR
jgi:formylglycine-generating enzyme required for sulfatase activity